MIVLVAGVSGSGKSTVGSLLASELGWAFEDGDALHPAASVAKMRSGIPLTDADRAPWLQAVADWLDRRIQAGEPAVVACSALKYRYRERLRRHRPGLRIVLLTAGRELLGARLGARHGHFFRAGLLDSQLADLEMPRPAEQVLVLPADRPPAEIAAQIIHQLGLTAYRETSHGSEPAP